MNTTHLQVTISRCEHGQALVTLHTEPFNGYALRLNELHRLINQLNAAAAAAATLHSGKFERTNMLLWPASRGNAILNPAPFAPAGVEA